ncbi:MAG: NAD(P)-dependent glycerol-3-phosphate dehydrogenase [Deltaproteobacteria bacterium]|nr:NAD(P)-dependent glycerol-3-phosphate dehydrogenase [Deltaproteobacteria bacterium]
MANVTVLGAGAWGTALAIVLARSGHTVKLAVRRKSQLAALRHDRENRAYLSAVQFPSELHLVEMSRDSIRDADAIVMAIPSGFARETLAPIASAIPQESLMISVSKGIEQDSLRTMSQMLAELAPPTSRIAVLSGPGFALEIARGKPAALVAAAHSEAVAGRIQHLFAAKPLRVYRSLDVIGVELGGASKNVIAIAAGISDGLALGSGARAALITRGLAEMMRLAGAAGAKQESLAGLAGLGDLVLTSTGDLSRNRRLGLALGRGEQISLPAEGASIAEGISNARAIVRLAERYSVEVPISSAVHRVLYEAASPGAMVEELLSRELKAEF